MQLVVADFDVAWNNAVEVLANPPGDDVRLNFEKIRSELRIESLSSCIHRYLSAELDFVTPGDRGMGRMLPEPPRLGAHVRRQLERLPPEQRAELYGLCRNLLLGGYLAFAMEVAGGDRVPTPLSPEKLLLKWIPRIYTTDMNQAPKGMMDALQIWTAKALSDLAAFIRDNAIKGGGLFGGDRVREIMSWYIVAGLALRSCEVEPA